MLQPSGGKAKIPQDRKCNKKMGQGFSIFIPDRGDPFFRFSGKNIQSCRKY